MSEIVAEGIVPAERLQQYVDTMLALVDESKIHFNDDGLIARFVDPANVASTIPATLEASGFESYDAPGSVTIGANLQRLDDFISNANTGDLIQLQVDMEVRKLRISYRNIEHKMALIDPDAIRQEPDDPGLDLPNKVVLEGGDLSEAVDVADLVSDHIDVVCGFDDDGEGEVTFVGRGDTDDSDYTLESEALLGGSQINQETVSKFSIDYLVDMTKPIPDDAEVSMHVGEDFPVMLEWEAADGHIQTKQLLAPRIDSN